MGHLLLHLSNYSIILLIVVMVVDRADHFRRAHLQGSRHHGRARVEHVRTCFNAYTTCLLHRQRILPTVILNISLYLFIF